MSRVLDANLIMAGSEPKIQGTLSQIDLVKCLNWYSNNKDTKTAEKWTIDYFKKNLKLDVSNFTKDEPTNFGFVCRIVSNGGVLPEDNQKWFENKINTIKKKIQGEKTKKAVIKIADNKNVVSIQDRVNEKINEIAGDIEGAIDDIILSKFKDIPSPYAIMQDRAKAMHAKKLLEIFKIKRAEFDSVLNTKDEQIKEGYSNFNKSQLKKLIAFCDQIIEDCLKISGESVKSRKTRKRKVKSADELVKKLNYCESIDELKIKSVAPKDVVGAIQLWVYNVKTRKVGCYHASDSSGLSVKGSSIVNYNETKSTQKKVRKPEVTLPEILKGGKVYLRNAIENIRAVESELNGRINKDTVLLRIVK